MKAQGWLHKPSCRWLIASVLVLVHSGCSTRGIQSALDPRSDQAAKVALLWWVMLAVGTLVLLGTLLLLAMAVLQRTGEVTELSARRKWTLVLAGGVAAPLLVVFGLVIYSVFVGRHVAAVPQDAPVIVEVTGRQWWWDVQYRLRDGGLNARTANEIHVPVGVPVKFVLKSRDVIHSFWMPNFQGKTDLIPGRENHTWVTAREPGVFRGQCAEFCGLQHALMGFTVIAELPEQFNAWLAQQARVAVTPTEPALLRGQQTFLTKQCVLCHTIRGTVAQASVAPDLTHVGGRLSLAAGTLANTPGHLSGWLADPQRVKPGNHMPNLYLSAQELHELTAFLESLK
jgi:cytochrome c oxidase subunit II